MSRSVWNGLERLTYHEVLGLDRPSAARWWRETCDPEGLAESLADAESLARVFAEPWERDVATRAMRFGFACYTRSKEKCP